MQWWFLSYIIAHPSVDFIHNKRELILIRIFSTLAVLQCSLWNIAYAGTLQENDIIIDTFAKPTTVFEKLTQANEIYLAKTPAMSQHLSLKNSTGKSLWITFSPYVSALSV